MKKRTEDFLLARANLTRLFMILRPLTPKQRNILTYEAPRANKKGGVPFGTFDRYAELIQTSKPSVMQQDKSARARLAVSFKLFDAQQKKR